MTFTIAEFFVMWLFVDKSPFLNYEFMNERVQVLLSFVSLTVNTQYFVYN